ncbi:MAG: ATP-binding protein [Acidovorax sp.]|nr:ATP-binding protein [Acidovorax sp.]
MLLTATPQTHRVERNTERKNMRLLIQLRWLAVLGQVITISLVHSGMDIALPMLPMMAVALALALTNLGYGWWLQWRPATVTPKVLFVALLIDVAALTLQLYWSGGAHNPFIYLFLLQVILGTVLLRPQYAWAMVAITAVSVVGLSFYYRPLPVVLGSGLPNLYTLGLLICFALTTVLMVVFITQVVSNLRQRDSRLADMRQRASEEEHIVRMGLLATGAAHELGTPLATMSVILGDWQRMPQVRGDADLMADLAEMQAQLLRCKAIVNGVLLSAGETRAAGLESTTLLRFLEQLVERWRQHHEPQKFFFTHQLARDLPILSDTALEQVICNVLDNAYEASPQEVHLHLECAGDMLELVVRDRGPGFDQAILAKLGKPYQSTKQGRPGRGVGLFLVVNVVRSLGGSVQAGNRVHGGAEVSIRLPLASITLENHHGHPTPTAAG